MAEFNLKRGLRASLEFGVHRTDFFSLEENGRQKKSIGKEEHQNMRYSERTFTKRWLLSWPPVSPTDHIQKIVRLKTVVLELY